MPRVPTVQGPSEELRAAPNVQQSVSAATPDAFGAVQARQLGAVADVLQRRQEQEDADAFMLVDADVKTQWLEHERSVRARRGQDAWGAAEDTKRWLEKTSKEAGAKLGNERQRRLFRKSFENLRLGALDAAGRHEDEQRRASLVESAQTRIFADINFAASDPTPRNIAISRDSIARSVEAVGRLNGWPAEKIAADKLNQTGAMHTQVLQQLVERDPFSAEAYFVAHKAEIPGGKHAELGHAIKLGTTKLKAQGFADDAVRRGMLEADAVKLVRERFSGDDEDTFATVLKGRYAEVRAQHEKVQGEAAEAAWSVVDRGGSWTSIPTAVQAALDPRTSIAIKAHLRERAKSAGVDRTRTDWTLYERLRDEAMNDPAGFSKKNLVQFFDRLAPAQRETLLDIKANALKSPGKVAEVLSDDKHITEAANQLKLKDDVKSRFVVAAGSALSAAQRVKGKALDHDERQKVLDRLAIEGTVKGSGWLFDDSKRAFEVQGTPEAERFVPKVPDADRRLIVEALQKAGRPVTDQAVVNLYKRRHDLK